MLKQIVKQAMVLSGLLTFLVPSIALSAQEQRIALVIGNGSYKSCPLTNPVNDANDMAAALRKLGFSVVLKTNANQRTMENSIRDFGKKLRSGGVGLFYFAGHGIQVRGRNYLISIGADIESEADVKYEAVDVGRVLSQMQEAENSANIIILDACRNNPYSRSFRSTERGLARMIAPSGSILAYATAPGSIAGDGTGRNGLYTSLLLRHIMTPGIPIELFFKEVRKDVANISGKKQVPWTESSLIGDFFFNTNRGISVAERPVDADLETERKRLELERMELERLTIEIERKKLEDEHKKIVAEKRKSQYASISPEVSEPKVIARDAHFIKYGNDIVFDTKTNLEWYAESSKNVLWAEAKRRVSKLKVDGGGWRMPSIKELGTLFQSNIDGKDITNLLNVNYGFIWSGEKAGEFHAKGLNFENGQQESRATTGSMANTYMLLNKEELEGKVIAVRNRK
jgi:hypothetical protein